jgi:hypothetical protein
MLKTKTERMLAFVVVFLVGCEASRVAHVVEPAVERTARAGTPAQRFEYYCWRGTEGITDAANTLARQGWEMTAAAGTGAGTGLMQHETMVWCFERPLGVAGAAPPPVSAQ